MGGALRPGGHVTRSRLGSHLVAQEVSTEALKLALAPFGRRLRVQRAMEVSAWVLAGAVLFAALGWLLWGLPAVVVVGVAWLIATLTALFWALPLGQIARYADDNAGLNAAADTALHLHAQTHPAAEAVALDALDGLQGALPPAFVAPRASRWLLASALLSLIIVGLGSWEGEPPEVEPERSEALQRLDRLEEEARRRGQTELVDAVRELKARLKEAEATVRRPPEAVARREAPPPRPPPPVPDVEPEPEPEQELLPDDVASQEELNQAIQRAERTMSTDDQLLAELADELERHLIEVTQFQELGQDMLAETFDHAEEDHALGEMRGPSNFSMAQNFQQRINQNVDQIEQGAGATFDPVEASGMRENEMDDAGHELVHALQQSYKDFLDAYAQALRDELLEAMRDATMPEDGGEEGDGEGLDLGSEQATGGSDKKADLSEQANMMTRPAGAEQAAQQMAEAQGQGKGKGTPTAGGDGETSKGGQGGGGGAAQDGEAAVDRAQSSGGDIDRLEGELAPGQLNPAQREAMLDAMSRMAVSSGPNSDFGDPWQGYFDEVERALVEEDLPPMMEGVVRAYFSRLQEER